MFSADEFRELVFRFERSLVILTLFVVVPLVAPVSLVVPVSFIRPVGAAAVVRPNVARRRAIPCSAMCGARVAVRDLLHAWRFWPWRREVGGLCMLAFGAAWVPGARILRPV